MPKGSTWTTTEDGVILKHRGKLSVEEIAELLGRSTNAVEVRARRKKIGSLRHRKRELVWCSKCSAYRTRINKFGCPVCNVKMSLHDKRSEEARLYALLPQDSKERKRPQTHGSYKSKRPIPTDTKGMDAYSRIRAEEYHSIAVERWELTNIRRELRAIQKRCERYCREIMEP